MEHLWPLLVISLVAWIIYAAFKRKGWSKSENGNDTILVGGSRVTIFPQDGGWKFCIADPADRDPPFFSGWYRSPDEAKLDAIATINGQATSRDKARAAREKAARESAPETLAGAEAKLEQMAKAVRTFKRLKSPTKDKLDRLTDRLDAARGQAQHAHHHLIDCDAPAAICARAGSIPMKIIDLKDEAITHFEGRTANS